MNDSVPSGKFKRVKIAGVAVAKAGAKQLGHLSKRPFLSDKTWQDKQKKLHANNADALFRVLCRLRGTALKIAQMLSMETDLLPREFHDELAKSYHQVPPLNRALVRKVVITELGEPPENLFHSFQGLAFAGASLGQVHQATSHQGDLLAVKLQYPGIASTIDSDLQLVRGLVKKMPKGDMAVEMLDEIKERLEEETDYEWEAEQIRWFAENLSVDNIVIPRIYDQWSSKRILAMEHLEGKHLPEWLEGKPSQKERNHFAQLIYDLYIRSLFELKRFHADPNPGNYLFRKDGTLGLIDFGCVKKLTPEFSGNYSKLYRLIVQDNVPDIIDTYAELGMLHVDEHWDSKAFVRDVLQPFHEWCAQPFKEETFDFGANPGYAAKVLKLMRNFHRYSAMDGGFLKVNRNFVFTDRTVYGLYKMFEQMGAKIHMRNQWTVG